MDLCKYDTYKKQNYNHNINQNYIQSHELIIKIMKFIPGNRLFQ